MEATLTTMLADFSDRELPALTRRSVSLARVPGSADVIVGMRRTGKTWFMYQVMQELEREGVGRDQILYVNFEDERLLPLRAQDLRLVPEAFFRRYPQSHARRCHFFFDELQRIDGWESFVRRLLEAGEHRIVLTGSSSKLLSKEISTQLRGRSVTSELFPFSFREYLAHARMDVPSRLPGAAKRAIYEKAYEHFLLTGGFPAIQGVEADVRVKVLQGYVDSVLLRDVVERYPNVNVTALRYMIRHLARNPAGRFSVNRFHNDLASMGIPVAKDSLYEYFGHLNDAYLYFPVYMHTRSERARMVNPRKVYPIDTGLAAAFSPSPSSLTGQLLESAVHLDLRRHGQEIEYYQTESGHEVDFLASRPDSRPMLIQSCVSLRDPTTRNREVRSLADAMRELRIGSATVVTFHESDAIKLPDGRIDVVPAWWWSLSPKP